MKTLKVLIILALLVVISILGMRYCERSRQLSGLDSQAKKLDGQLENPFSAKGEEILKTADAYLKEVLSVLGRGSALSGDLLKPKDKKIIFEDSVRRMRRLKEVIRDNPSLDWIGLSNWKRMIDGYYADVGTICMNKKDQILRDLLHQQQKSGELDSAYFTEDESDLIRDESMKKMYAREAQERAQAADIRKKEAAEQKIEPIPMLEDALALKQREVTRINRLAIGKDDLESYRGQELHFQLQDGRRIIGTYAGGDPNQITVSHDVGGGSVMTSQIPREQVEKIEKVTTEKVFETYDPAAEHESSLREDFAELAYAPYPKTSPYVGMITLDNVLVFIDGDSGVLTCHTKETSDGFTPMATPLPSRWAWELRLHHAYRQAGSVYYKDYFLYDLPWYRPLENRTPFDSSVEYNRLEGDFDYAMELRLVKRLPDSPRPVILYQRNLAINAKTVRLLFCVKNIDRAIYDFGNPKFGKGKRPWEYEFVQR